MRLNPIEKPGTLMLKLTYWMSKRRLGKVITPLKTVYARVPEALRIRYEIAKFDEKGPGLEPELKHLVKAVVAHTNGCSFCVDIGAAVAAQKRVSGEKLLAVADFESSPLFSDREHAAFLLREVFDFGYDEIAGLDVSAKLIDTNGGAGIAFRLNGVLQSVWSLEVSNGRIERIYVVLNPDKPARMQGFSQD